MKRLLLSALIAVAWMVPALRAQSLVDNRLRIQTWASGLSSPTTFTWIGSGEMLVIQKNDGKVKWILDGTVKGTALDLKVQNDSERGGLGIAADPDFANNHYVYVYYSSTSATSDSGTFNKWVDNRVERYDWNGTNLVNAYGPLVAFPSDATQGNGPNHDGGVIRFGPDGMLYGQTGDLNRGRFGSGSQRVEQNTAASGSAMVGGFFRIANDGSIPADNPFITEADPAFHLWWSYGLRNGFGFTWDAVTGMLWDTENGPDKYDEVNRVPFAANSGWLKIMGPDARDAKYGENNNKAYNASDLTALVNSVYVDPAFSFLSPVGITAISFVHTKRFPYDLRDDCVFADSNFGNLYFAEMRVGRDNFKLPAGLGDKVADNSTERDAIKWGAGWSAATDIQVGADGYLYVVSLGLGKILRIRPVTDAVEPGEMRFPRGVLFIGKIELMDSSDDKSYRAEERARSNWMPPYNVLARFQVNDANPASMDLELEDRFPLADNVQNIYVHNFNTKRWQLLDSAVIGGTDVLRTISFGTPADYIDPTTLSVEVRVEALPWNHRVVGLQPRNPINIAIDLFRLNVTYP